MLEYQCINCREYGHEYAERGSGQYTYNRKQHDIDQNSCGNTILIFLCKRLWEYAAICDTAVPPERHEANTDTAAPIELIFIPLPNAAPMESCDASILGIPRTM